MGEDGLLFFILNWRKKATEWKDLLGMNLSEVSSLTHILSYWPISSDNSVGAAGSQKKSHYIIAKAIPDNLDQLLTLRARR